MPQPIDYEEIINGLTSKTDEGKIGWTQVFSENTFACTLPGGDFTFRVHKWDDEDTFFGLSMNDGESNEVFRIESRAVSRLGSMLAGLHESARRVALDVLPKINAAKDILEKI